MTENKRVIKFRAYSKLKNRMIWGPSEGQINSAWVYAMATMAGYEYDVSLMQNTGLLDKNGKEIYDGDIIRYSFGWDYTDKDFQVREFKKGKKAGNYIGHVEWEGGEFAHFVINPNRLNLTTTSCLVEIIGNIYDHKNLLKHGK